LELALMKEAHSSGNRSIDTARLGTADFQQLKATSKRQLQRSASFHTSTAPLRAESIASVEVSPCCSQTAQEAQMQAFEHKHAEIQLARIDTPPECLQDQGRSWITNELDDIELKRLHESIREQLFFC
jgi:hypothetical protein